MKIDFSTSAPCSACLQRKTADLLRFRAQKGLVLDHGYPAGRDRQPRARENWQAAQLRNLLAHAAQRSSFWRQRIGPRKNYADVRLSSLPALTRADLRQQVGREGSLLPPGTEPTQKHATSGSSGTPVEFFVSRMNGYYNSVRGLAQHFVDGRDLSLNITRFKSLFTDDPRGFHGLQGRYPYGPGRFRLERGL